jgi:hypothetical protein
MHELTQMRANREGQLHQNISTLHAQERSKIIKIDKTMGKGHRKRNARNGAKPGGCPHNNPTVKPPPMQEIQYPIYNGMSGRVPTVAPAKRKSYAIAKNCRN